MTVLLIAGAALVATFIGGAFAIRFRDHLHLILGFSAGAVLGVALFDLLPEAIELSSSFYSARTLTLAVAVGFLVYLLLDQIVFVHSHDEDGHEHDGNADRGMFGAGTLSLHSFLDGIAIGVGFQASPAIGLIVAAAVLTHDFSDGINTVSVVLRNSGSKAKAFRWLLVDALAPVLGAASTLLFSIPEQYLGLILGVFAGCFLYLGAVDLIPESHHRHPRALTTVMTLIGALTLYVVVALAG